MHFFKHRNLVNINKIVRSIVFNQLYDNPLKIFLMGLITGSVFCMYINNGNYDLPNMAMVMVSRNHVTFANVRP
jgi:uncharacterized membrane protein